MPTKRLPARANIKHLRQQAKDLLAACAAGQTQALQRLREFHPRFAGSSDGAIADAKLSWSDGLFAIAREYGFASWPRLNAAIATPGSIGRSFRDRIGDPLFRDALDSIDDGDIAVLRGLIEAHPDLVTRRTLFEGENYFRAPALLAFVAENPVRNDSLPPNILEIAELLLRYGATEHDRNETIALVASGRVSREAGVQGALIDLLCRYGADPNRALVPAAVHGEFAAVAALLNRGAVPTLPIAASLGDLAGVSRLLDGSDAAERHLALALSAQHGCGDVVALLLEHGEDPDRYNPVGAHSHSTPLHQAAFYGHAEAVRALLRHGASVEIRDTLWNGTAIDWALHAERPAMVQLLREG